MNGSLRAAATALVLMLASAGLALAQSDTNVFDGFSGKSKDPVKIEADRLEVRQKDEAAVFTGNVVVVQGESTLRTRQLTIYYVDKPAPTEPGSVALATSGRDIRRLEAEGDVVVTSKDQRATGDRGNFDMAKNTVVLTGNVVVSQGGNVVKGDRLVADLTTQRSRLESDRAGGRVQGLFIPGSQNRPDQAQGAAARQPANRR